MIIKIRNDESGVAFPESLTSVLRKKGIHFPLYCGGNGQCGKCRIRIVEGHLAVTAADRQVLTEEQLVAGYRLGCRAVVESACVIALEEAATEQNFFVPLSGSCQPASGEETNDLQKHLGIAVDIGTTTIAMAMVNLETGSICREYTGLNHQRSYGTDVMARINASVKGNGNVLQKIIREDLTVGIFQLLQNERGNVEQIAIAGNTTMIHLLRGYDCSGLGQYPFQPYSLSFEYLTAEETFGMAIPALADAKVVLMPGISAFIGGDITAGLWGCRIFTEDKPQLFLDLGTNAEMAVGCKEQILATSAAAGPAFEGGQIACGVGSVPGAIRKVQIQYGLVRYETIGKKSPVGICGTGLISAIAELKRNGLMNTDGTLKPRYLSSGFQIVQGNIRITQADIREFQKAKAAIRAGLDILIASGEYNIEEIECLHLAGGFGCQMNAEDAREVGLIPEVLADRVHLLGNAVIQGLISYMKEPDPPGIEVMVSKIQEFSLSAHPLFKKKFLSLFAF